MTDLVLVRHGETVWHAENRYAGLTDVALTPRGLAQAARLAEWAAGAGLEAVWASPLSRARITAETAAAQIAPYTGHTHAAQIAPHPGHTHAAETAPSPGWSAASPPATGPGSRATAVGSRGAEVSTTDAADATDATGAEAGAAGAGLAVRVDERLRELDFGQGDGLTSAEMKALFPEARAAFEEDPATNPLPGGENPHEAAGRFVAALRDIAAAHPGGRVLVVAHTTAIRLALCHLIGVPLGEYRRLFPRLDNCALTELRVRDGQVALLQYNSPIGAVR
ncbi:histidine phosphatase family protein [Nonomuraea sp. PA05]|uniref:histidine phosphatase family protein n=1 Tax=Nonomuraea sp. PA05 TaxID=2604466 RepID=UPI0011D5C657|nr:histidine phosphatase family protein [Nonomuraea sp. PA05]TYB52224.1 histidine phosphatase family protein [Nonomuraea sp. PA05]